jgi:hypothetical protein
MSPIKKIFGLGLATIMDVGSGVIITHIIWTMLGLDIHWWNYVIGVLFSILPDFDELVPLTIELLGGPENDSPHKALPTHFPIVATPTAAIILLLIAPQEYAILVSVCLLVHFFHDSWQSQQDGPGVMWLAPFGKNYYQFFSKHAKEEKLKLFLVASPDRVSKCFEMNYEDWLNSKFFRLTWENAIGIMVFLVAMTILYMHFF